MGIMLILRGIKNLLHEEPAKAYAELWGFVPEVLDASGETGQYSDQTNKAIARIQKGDIEAIYGFSGGGYNAVHIWSRLSEEHKRAIKKIVVVGSPGVTKADFDGVKDVTIWNKPGVAHMEQPAALLESVKEKGAEAPSV